MTDDDSPIIRPDFEPARLLLVRLLVYARQFRDWDLTDWPHLRNREDFDQIYRLPIEKRSAYEQLYQDGRDLAVSFRGQLTEFQVVGEYPTFTDYVDRLSTFIAGWAAGMRSTIDAARTQLEAAERRYWSVDQMIALCEQQMKILSALVDWIPTAKSNLLYFKKTFAAASLSPSVPTPKGTTTMSRPRVFIGSSVEGLAIANHVQLGLDHDAETKVWSQGVFGLSGGTLESLVNACKSFDFAVLVLKPDDVTTTPKKTKKTARDNVVFELGLFMGALGRERTFIVCPRDEPIDLPTDLAGITPATFAAHSDGNLEAALGPVCTQIRNAIAKQWTGPTAAKPKAVARKDMLDYQVTQLSIQRRNAEGPGRPESPVFLKVSLWCNGESGPLLHRPLEQRLTELLRRVFPEASSTAEDAKGRDYFDLSFNPNELDFHRRWRVHATGRLMFASQIQQAPSGPAFNGDIYLYEVALDTLRTFAAAKLLFDDLGIGGRCYGVAFLALGNAQILVSSYDGAHQLSGIGSISPQNSGTSGPYLFETDTSALGDAAPLVAECLHTHLREQRYADVDLEHLAASLAATARHHSLVPKA